MRRLRSGHGADPLNPGAGAPGSGFYRGLANGLTLGRFAVPLPFLYLMFEAHGGASGAAGALLLLYLLTAASDLLDGYFARKAGAPSPAWGWLDALADVLFNVSSLLAAAWLGRLGYWVPLGVAALGTQFLYRNRTAPPDRRPRLREDLPGKAAGVAYYLLVGAVVLGLWFDPARSPAWTWWTGNLVFAYTAAVFMWNLLRRGARG